VSEIAGIIDLPDQLGRRGQAAGGVYIAPCVLADTQVGVKFILRMILFSEKEQDLVQMGFAYAQISVLFRVCIYAHKVTGFQFPYMGSQSAVGYPQGLRKTVHTHSSVLNKKIQDIDPDL
jgi:hypothetical protein